MSLQIGLLLYPNLTQLDLTGPFEVFSHMPDTKVHLIWKTRDPVKADTGMQILPTMTMSECPDLDVICVPGGPGQIDIMDDQEVLEFVRTQGDSAKFVTSVCTGSLLLGAAGLLKGYKASTYWACTDMLEGYGAIYEKSRVVKDRNRITGGGVTAGIDFALTVVAELLSEQAAQMIQLAIEYNPAPPFNSGHPDVADPELVATLTAMMETRLETRRLQASSAAG
ncbi:MAG: DJ-1/PfpI family protein [Kordiimonadaceae bacterium]|nr:DJ-1/PfpI family protein [Kordiimonadaceae bacterium]MBO6568315.1 DJ-1/PfpI family protein [Kordiimonadaceae bacterium]MBO6963955.1 DJ-1/PfpI family protein [Kordiimonadaceae bacterium]